MRSENQIIGWLYDQAGIFDNYIRNKDYLAAALCADWAAMVAQFIKLDSKRMEELFGSRQDEDNPVKGLFKEEYRIRAGDWCNRNGYAVCRHTYQNVQKLI